MSQNNKYVNPDEYIKNLENMINDLILIIASKNIKNESFNINKAYRLIGTPTTLIEMGVAIRYTGGNYVTK